MRQEWLIKMTTVLTVWHLILEMKKAMITTQKVSWTDVSEYIIIFDDRRQRQPRKWDAAEGYHLTNIGEDMDNFLMAQTTHVASMHTVEK